MSIHLKVQLRNLKFGHEAPVHPGNARVTGRTDGIAELAAHIFGRGKIDDLLVYDDGVPDTYYVANGNRSLAALRMIYGEQSEELIDCKLTTAERAYEDSLAVAVLVRKFHPVDEYEGFAKLRDQGKTNEEIAREYGLSEKQVRQALALGALSPKIRDAWRTGEIRAEVAQAFTLAKDHKSQDKIFNKLDKDDDLSAHSVRSELGIKSNRELAGLVAFITPDLYRERGGTINEDLFGEYHSISDEPLVKTLATEKLDQCCADLIKMGWAWAKPLTDLPNGAMHWSTRQIPEKDWIWKDGEKERRADADKKLKAMENDSAAWDHDEQERLEAEIDAIDREVNGRSFTPKQMEKLGCIVDIEDGKLEITYGVTKPAEQLQEKRGPTSSSHVGDSEGQESASPAPVKKESTTISNALADSLGEQLMQATKDALLADTAGGASILVTLAGIVHEQIKPQQKFHMPSPVTHKLAALRAALSPAAMNAAIAKRFDAKDYFSRASKVIVLKAVKEAVNADEARKLTETSKLEIAKFAMANVVKAGWLPKELRTPHYVGPGSDGYKKPAAAKRNEPTADEKTTALPPKAVPKTVPAKPASSSKKPIKKTSAKKPAKKAAPKKAKKRKA
jgi:ParB family transcriptional regulator, chromosome partitioning protein